MKVKINVDVALSNPEDLFNDLIADGFTVHEALINLMESELLEKELFEKYPDMIPEITEDCGEGKYEITLKPWEDEN